MRRFVVAGILVAVLVAGLAGAVASDEPDGLERVARDQGFAGEADEHALSGSPVADYRVDGVDDDRVSTGLAGVLGVVVTFALGTGLLLVVRRRSSRAG
ncbi:MAG TPA: PDGLE domain-containing protein [Acidimicrobiales bacterium]|jgi:hypothetical protein